MAGNKVADFEFLNHKISRTPDFIPVFVHWGNENQFPQVIAEYAAKNNQTLVIYWEAMDYNYPDPAGDPRYSYDQLLSGQHDDYLTSFSLAAKASNQPIIIIPFEEMNGDWYPWALTLNGNSPQKHIEAFRYLRKFFTDSPTTKFAWVVNRESESIDLTAFYPGNDYVDYVGVNGFNFGTPWQSFAQVFSLTLDDLKTLNKPLYIFSMASAEGEKKADWIKNAGLEITKDPQISGWIWFNENKERDWRIWSDPQSLSAFRTYMLNQAILIN